MTNIKDILESLGYKLTDDVNGWRMRPLYRDSKNDTSLKVYHGGNFVDFSAGIKGSFEELVKLTNNLETIDKAREWLKNKDFEFIQPNKQLEEPLIKEVKKLKRDFIDKLDRGSKAQEYWINRGISLKVLEELGGGLYKDKYYFPIFNTNNELLGWSARIIKGNTDGRYIIRGEKKNFLYGGLQEINDSKKAFIHEGIPDMASMMTIGVRNNLVQFGTEISFTVINFLLRIPNVVVYLCQNNDKAGRESAEKNRRKLLKYFDSDQIKIKEVMGKNKDLNDILKNESSEMLLKWVTTS